MRTKDGRQRQTLQSWLTRLVDALHGRIHGFNVSVAHVWAEQERLLDKAGQRMPVEDSYIAATARRHGLTIATGNDRDFRRPGLKSVSTPSPFDRIRILAPSMVSPVFNPCRSFGRWWSRQDAGPGCFGGRQAIV